MSKVACIGAGLVGSAWAVVFARGGHEVVVQDIGGAAAETAARAVVAQTLALINEAGLLGESASAVAARIRFTETIADAVAQAFYVQESVKEDVAVKRAVFGEIAEHAPKDAILASSTSAIPGSRFLDIACPERALVAHPVNPPSLIPLVELCGTGWTSPETVAQTRAFMEELGMKPVTVLREIDGFLLNRLQFTLVAEAMHLVGEGYCTAADIDRVLTDGLALRWATIGPFEVAHLNSAHGYKGFTDHLGDMMRRVGADAHTDYVWPQGLAASIHEELVERIPLDGLAQRQGWRNGNILAVRRLQADAEARARASTTSTGTPT